MQTITTQSGMGTLPYSTEAALLQASLWLATSLNRRSSRSSTPYKLRTLRVTGGPRVTQTDEHIQLPATSRYSLGLMACADETDATVRGHLTAVFRRYGLPEAMLSDNGSPWGGSGSRGYAAFEVWLMRLGIGLHHGRPYHPQTQGNDERFHRTLDVEVLQMRPCADLAAYLAAFDVWRPIYNEQRPHEGLGMAVPVSRYKPSQTPFAELLTEPQ
jgi:transposase InsO family protein